MDWTPKDEGSVVMPASAAVRNNADNDFVSVKSAAERITVSEPTIRRFLTQKRLRRFKAGRRTLIKLSDLMGLVKEVK
jgi:excisionase family DNA binding protein